MIKNNIGWNFDNTYLNLSEMMISKLAPVPVKNPNIILYNKNLAEELGLNFSHLSEKDKASIFSGNSIPEKTTPWAEAYAGHQFGHFVMLGDGRALMLGEHVTSNKKRFDIQLKGSGITPYSRSGDGRAALGPMLREYIISEAIHHLSIPTSRSLAVVSTGQNVMRENILPGAILTRVASSHIRVGTFEFVAAQKDSNALQELIIYCIDRHYPELKGKKIPALQLFRAVMNAHADLIINYMRVGFIHGVLNTDNVTISGESIDYGPCAFLDLYDPKTKFSSIDQQGRYAFGNQPIIAKWNMARFAETLIPLIDINLNKAIQMLEDEVNEFSKIYINKSLKMMRNKLGIKGEVEEDSLLIKELLTWMESHKADYTNTFRSIMNERFDDSLYKDQIFQEWFKKLQKRKPNKKLMKQNNPLVIPRNHKVEEVLKAAEQGNYDPLTAILSILKNPYTEDKKLEAFQNPAPESATAYQTFCGT
jgi:uncharacterized protein YdiU (UPF0061 family)